MGAWIETLNSAGITVANLVAPYMGAWIETLSVKHMTFRMISRTLHGCVD